ncbi:MAG TPA: lysophospholipid acyltransferase family protein, partial [Deltaproteobacteria bacterium]|nr:lysophospholipid acyltransferase family protein [Deltaproteobacteria bacterium]
QLLLMKAFVLLIRALPRRAAVRAGRLMGLLAWLCVPLHRKIARAQMSSVLGAGYRESLLRESFMHQGGLFMDMIKIAYMNDDELRDQVVAEGREHLEGALASGRNVMIIAGHMNWEILGHTPRVFGIEVCVMADLIKNPAIQAISDEIRSRCRIRLLPPKGGMVNRYLEDLRDGRIVGLIIDQRGKRENRLFCDVLGLPAPTNPAPAYIALKGDALILPLAGFNEGGRQGGRYIFRWYEPIDSRDFGTDHSQVHSLGESCKSGAVRDLSCAMHTWLSSVIREQPEQWFWLHCRWLRRSDMKRIVRKGLDFRKSVAEQADGCLTDGKVGRVKEIRG